MISGQVVQKPSINLAMLVRLYHIGRRIRFFKLDLILNKRC